VSPWGFGKRVLNTRRNFVQRWGSFAITFEMTCLRAKRWALWKKRTRYASAIVHLVYDSFLLGFGSALPPTRSEERGE